MFLVNNDSAVDFSKILARNAVVEKQVPFSIRAELTKGGGKH
jgi:hypothetical protein